MAHQRLLLAGPILWLLAASPVGALQILPLQDDRIVSVTFQGTTTQQKTPGPGFPTFADAVFFVGAGEAIQNTTIAPTQMSGTGSDFTDGAADTSGRSVFDVAFRVDEAVAYALSGSVYGYAATFPIVRLSSPGSVLFEPVFPGGVGPYPFSDSGLLLPGVDYRLLVASMHAGLPGGEGNEWSFAFSIAAPEPAGGTMLLLAALLLHARAPRRAA